MKAHERIKIALISLFATFSIFAFIVYLIYDNAESDVIIFFVFLCLAAIMVVIHHIVSIIKDWQNAKKELSEWSTDNPKESIIMGISSMFGGVAILLFYLWPYRETGFSDSSPDDIEALGFGIIGAIIFFVIGIVLLHIKNKKYPY